MLCLSAIASFLVLDSLAWPREPLLDALDNNVRELQRSVIAAGPHVHVDRIEDLQFTESDEPVFLYNTITGAPDSARRAWLHSHFFGKKNAIWYLTPRNDTEQNREDLRSNEWALPLETVAVYHDLYEPEFATDTEDMRVLRCQLPAHFLALARDLVVSGPSSSMATAGHLRGNHSKRLWWGNVRLETEWSGCAV